MTAADSHGRQREAICLMTDFAERTGLTSDKAQRRYLWTDAFAVCNFLGLARATGQQSYTELALLLVQRVHETLGKHRADDARAGWLSGLDEMAGRSHPTRGGLRIGKPLPERGPLDPFHQDLEWDRDGQYFHYLTKWMHALDQVSRETRDPRFNLWARELAQTACSAFSYRPPGGGRARMAWKMSVDLTRPLGGARRPRRRSTPGAGTTARAPTSPCQAVLPWATSRSARFRCAVVTSASSGP